MTPTIYSGPSTFCPLVTIYDYQEQNLKPVNIFGLSLSRYDLICVYL